LDRVSCIANRLIAGENIKLFPECFKEQSKKFYFKIVKTMYTKEHFGKELKEQLLKNKTIEQIGAWAVAAYYDHVLEIEPSSGVRKLLLSLGAMEEGPQFLRSYKELHEIANKLIAGEDVKL
jgi:hypothetical protein